MTALRQALKLPWIWSFIGAVAVWLATIAHTGGQGAGEIVTAALSFGCFTVIVGTGQMLVVTTGPGNVDLSIPATITLCGTVAMKIMDEQNGMIAIGIVAAFGAGAIVGVLNYALIRFLRIPPIIATLAMSFLVQSTAIAYNRGIRIKPPGLVDAFTTGDTAGIPWIAVLTALFSVAIWVLVSRSYYGRAISAIGQNARAAWLANIPVERFRLLTYVGSALMSAACGILLSGFSGGPALDMGAEYLLGSIAVVVIGGTSVAGGRASVPGIWGAALFMFLLVNMLNTFGASAGIRLILTGVIIIAVIAIAGGEEQR
ncbi:MAG TPA: ABC transporter permease [Candidatus Cybelea sp.]|nr:ABC transporter permease [Candidatus Cybelea sp.]